VTFNWRTDNADGVNLLRNGTAIVAQGLTNGSTEDCPPANGLYEYRLDAYSDVGQVSQTVMVNMSNPSVTPHYPALNKKTSVPGARATLELRYHHHLGAVLTAR